MISRISDNTKFDTVVRNLSPLEKRGESVLEQLSTQKKINRPSDDPEGMKTVLGLRATGEFIEQYQANITNADAWLKITESNLEGVTDLLLLVRGMVQNVESASIQERNTVANSLQEINDQILSCANAQVDGRYLFAGSMTDTKPFPDSTSGYKGDDLSLLINVGKSSSLDYNITGSSVFTFTNTLGVVDDIFRNFENLKTVLQNPASTEADISAAVTSLNEATEQVQGQVEENVVKAETMLANLEYTNNHLSDLHDRVSNMLSNKEDADVAKLATEFQMRLLALNATYSVATKIEESSLMNFLG